LRDANMTFDELCTIVWNSLVPKLEGNLGLSVFARERSKFEGWLKVELIESFSHRGVDVVPERDRVDVSVGSWAIELKTVNTNYRYQGAKNKHRPITKNIDGIVKDIQELRRARRPDKAVVFVVFPLRSTHKDWTHHILKIKGELSELRNVSFAFRNGLPGVVYVGLIK